MMSSGGLVWALRCTEGISHKLKEPTFFIGRDLNADLQIQSRSVDQHHAVITSDLARNLVQIHDLGSVNGCQKEIDHSQYPHPGHIVPHPHGQPIPHHQQPGVHCQDYLVEQKQLHGYHGYSHPPASYPNQHGYVPCPCQACVGPSLRYSPAFDRARSFDTAYLPPRSSHSHPSRLAHPCPIPHPMHDRCSHGYFPLYMRPGRSRPRPKRPMSVHGDNYDAMVHRSGVPMYGPTHSDLYGRPQWWGWGSSDEDVYSYPYTATMVTQEHSTTTKQTVTVKTRKTMAQREAMARKRHTIHGFPSGGFVENQEQMLVQQVMNVDNTGHDNEISNDEVFFQPRQRQIQNVHNKQAESLRMSNNKDSADNNNNNNNTNSGWEMIEWERGKDNKELRVEEYEDSSDSLSQDTLQNISSQQDDNDNENFEKDEISDDVNVPMQRTKSSSGGLLPHLGRRHSCSKGINCRKYSVDSINSGSGESEYESCSSGDNAGVFNLTELRGACDEQGMYNEYGENETRMDEESLYRGHRQNTGELIPSHKQEDERLGSLIDCRNPAFMSDSKSPGLRARSRTTVGTMTDGTTKKKCSGKEDKTGGTSRPKSVPHSASASRISHGSTVGRGSHHEASQRSSSSRSTGVGKLSRLPASSLLQRSISTTSESDASRTPSPKLNLKSGTDDSDDDTKSKNKHRERKVDDSSTDRDSGRKSTDTSDMRSPVRTVPPRNNKSSMLRAASAREPAKVKPSFLSRSRSVSSLGSVSCPGSPAKTIPRVWTPSSRASKSKAAQSSSAQDEHIESTCYGNEVVDGTCTPGDDSQAVIDAMFDNAQGIPPLSRNEPLNRTFVLDTMSHSQSSSSLSSPDKEGHKMEFTFSSDSLAETEPHSSTLTLENTSTCSPRLVPFAPISHQARMPFTPPPVNNQPFVPPGDEKACGSQTHTRSQSLGNIPERTTTPISGQRRQWDISDKPVEDLMMSSINAFSAELRQAAESALVKVKSLYDSLESKEKAALNLGDEFPHPFPHLDNSKNDESSIPDWKPTSAEIAGIFRNLRKVELRLRTMDHALSNMCVTAKIEEAKRDLDPAKPSDHKWKDFKDEARKHSWIANQREDFAFTDSEDEDTA